MVSTSGSEPRLPGAEPRNAGDAYFDAMHRLEAALDRRDYAGAAPHVHESLKWLPGWVRELRAERRRFDVQVIHALERGGTALALIGDREGLAEMRRVVESEPELEPWLKRVRQHEIAARIVPQIEDLARTRPVCLQSEMKGLLGVDDGPLVGRLIQYLEKAGRIARVRTGRTWRLLPPDSPEIPPPEPPEPIPIRPVRSHRADDEPPPLREVEVSELPRIDLREAAGHRELPVEGDSTPLPALTDAFEVRDASLRIVGMERLPRAARPDPALRRFHPSRSGLFVTTDRRHFPHYGGYETGAIHYDRSGRISARETLPQGSYRFYCPPFGRALIAVSRHGVAHAYDESLQMILETPLEEAPEVRAWKSGLPEERTDPMPFAPPIAIAPDAGRYLFGLDDRVWCVDRRGRGLWGLRFPKAGWLSADDYYGEDEEPLDLGPPPAPDERHRTQGREVWKYPDEMNPDDFFGSEKAVGPDKEQPGLPTPDEPVPWMPRFIREVSKREAVTPLGEVSLREIEVSDTKPAHFVLDVAFSSSDDTAFIATRDGLIFAVDGDGEALRVIDGIRGPWLSPGDEEIPGWIPSPADVSVSSRFPHRMVHHDDYLYLMTATQLYVLHRDALLVVLDLARHEDFYCTRNGFFLHQAKRIRAFRKDGGFLGSLLSKDPIRRLYQAGADTVIETRTRRAVVSGIPVW